MKEKMDAAGRWMEGRRRRRDQNRERRGSVEEDVISTLAGSLSEPAVDSIAALPDRLIEDVVLNGIRPDVIEHCRVLYSFTVTPRLGSPGGVLLGGVIATLVDVIGSIALSTCGLPTTGVSLDINISYLDAAMIGEEIEIEGKVLHIREPITVISVKLRKKATGKLIAEGRHTKYLPASSKL